MRLRVCWHATRFIFFSWWTDKVSYAGGQRDELKMTDYVSLLAGDSCLKSYVLESAVNEGGLGARFQITAYWYSQYSYCVYVCVCVAANTKSLKLAESFLIVHTAFLNYRSSFVPEKASPLMNPARLFWAKADQFSIQYTKFSVGHVAAIKGRLLPPLVIELSSSGKHSLNTKQTHTTSGRRMRSHLYKPRGAPQCHRQFICLLCLSEVSWTGHGCQTSLPFHLERKWSLGANFDASVWNLASALSSTNVVLFLLGWRELIVTDCWKNCAILIAAPQRSNSVFERENAVFRLDLWIFCCTTFISLFRNICLCLKIHTY